MACTDRTHSDPDEHTRSPIRWAAGYNAAMSLKHIDIELALRRLAEKRIEDAMQEGKFENLRGAGRPIELEPMPADENARLTWWALRILRQNDITPDEIVWRKHLDTLRERLAAATSEKDVRAIVGQINLLVYKLNTLGTNAIQGGVAGVSLDDELRRFHERQPAEEAS